MPTTSRRSLRANTEAALAAGVFGVPTLRVGHELFWGNDASAMVDDWLADPDRFDSDEYRRIAEPAGRRRAPALDRAADRNRPRVGHLHPSRRQIECASQSVWIGSQFR